MTWSSKLWKASWVDEDWRLGHLLPNLGKWPAFRLATLKITPGAPTIQLAIWQDVEDLRSFISRRSYKPEHDAMWGALTIFEPPPPPPPTHEFNWFPTKVSRIDTISYSLPATFSFASASIELYKQATHKALQKEKGIWNNFFYF